jgi:topoisomerase-4 subunit A
MGKDILFVGVWKKGDDRMVYNVIYTDGKSGKGFAKRFNMPGVTRDKEYPVATDDKNSRIHYVSGNPNGEAETIEIKLSQSSTARKKIFEYDFSELEVKGRGARGNTVTKYPIRKVDFVKAGTSTLSKLNLWYDEDAGRLNKDSRGKYLGKFDGDDQIITFTRNGSYKITGYELTTRFEPEKTLLVEKFNAKRPVSAIYVDGESKQYMVKRFMIETTTLDKEFGFISESIGSRLVLVTTSETPEVDLELVKGKDKAKTTETINLEEVVDVKGWKALGNRLSQFKVSKVSLVQEEESGLEGDDSDNDVVEAPAGKNSPPDVDREKKNGKTSRTTTNGSAKGSKQASSPNQKSPSSKPSKKVSQGQESKSSSKTSSRKTVKSKTKVKAKR